LWPTTQSRPLATTAVIHSPDGRGGHCRSPPKRAEFRIFGRIRTARHVGATVDRRHRREGLTLRASEKVTGRDCAIVNSYLLLCTISKLHKALSTKMVMVSCFSALAMQRSLFASFGTFSRWERCIRVTEVQFPAPGGSFGKSIRWMGGRARECPPQDFLLGILLQVCFPHVCLRADGTISLLMCMS